MICRRHVSHRHISHRYTCYRRAYYRRTYYRHTYYRHTYYRRACYRRACARRASHRHTSLTGMHLSQARISQARISQACILEVTVPKPSLRRACATNISRTFSPFGGALCVLAHPCPSPRGHPRTNFGTVGVARQCFIFLFFCFFIFLFLVSGFEHPFVAMSLVLPPFTEIRSPACHWSFAKPNIENFHIARL
jgi:hypothetical protein